MNLNKSLQVLVASFAFILTLTGCSGIMHHDPYNPNERHVNRTLLGTGTGTALGALGGGLWCGKPCAWVFGFLGGLTGFGVGFVLEEIEEEQKYELINAGVKVKKTEEGTYVFDLPKISFELGSSRLNTDAIEAIKAVAKIAKSEDLTVAIAGFASPDGDEAYNLKLSDERAQKVKAAFELEGIPSEDIVAKGVGESAEQGRSASIVFGKKS